MLDFLFITSPTNARNPHPPYYFLYLAAYLRKKGLNVDIIDVKGGDTVNEIKRHYREIASKIEGKTSLFVGLASFHSDYSNVMELGNFVKNILPNSLLLVGNAHATICPEDFIYEGSPFDVAVMGEGEETCWELYQGNNVVFSNLHEIKGIAFWQEEGDYYHGYYKEGKFIKTEQRQFMGLETLSMPAYDLVDMVYYLRPQKLIIRRIYTSMVCVFAGRGCPFNCDFCCANAVWKANKGKAARLRPVGDVVNEILYLKFHYNIDFFYLFDDMFGMSKKWMRNWFEAKMCLDWEPEMKGMRAGYAEPGSYKNWNKPKEVTPYACQTRADTATEEMIRGLKETGCIQLDIGVETGVERLLWNVNKKIRLDQTRQVFEWCRKYKIRSFATMLLNLPGETEEDLKATHKFLEEIKPTAGVIFGVTTPYPGTKIYEKYCEPKLDKDEYSLLINNRLNPIERFRLSEHKIDLEKLWDKWNRHFHATPMFERMWCLWPFQKSYWRTVIRSGRLRLYIKCWMKDLLKTFLLYWAHKLRIYRFLKKIQYRGSKKWNG